MEYRLDVRFEAVQLMASLRKVEEKRLMWWIERLRNAPFSVGQFTVLDDTGRDIQVSRVDRYWVFHWTDHAVKTVQVVKIDLNP